jgi:gentisate 1,2-dioxygenase
MGDGGFTTVQGEKCSMSRGDVVLTPNGTWHNHGNDGTEPVIWFDVLDLPLAEACNGSDFEFDYKEPVPHSNSKDLVERQYQTVSAPLDYSSKLYATGGILPRFLPHNRGRGFGSPQYVYRWKDTICRLQELREFEGDPRDGIVVEYVDPTSGGSALPTLSLRVQLLRANSVPEWQRNTANTMFCVFQGQGRTEFESTTLEWTQNDVFVAPSGCWYRNINATDDDLILYSVSDSPALEKLGFLRSQGRNSGGEITELTPNYYGSQK